MKTKFLIIALATFSAIFLTACFGNEKEDDDALQPEPQEVNADTVLDNRIFNEAVTSLNSKRCGEIKASAKKEECATVISSLALIDKAVQQKDKTVCKQITLERYAESCSAGVNKAIADSQREETALKEAQQQEKLAEEIFKSKDVEKCDELKDNYKISCKENILNALAVEKLDKTICEKHGEKEKVEQCKKLVEANQ